MPFKWNALKNHVRDVHGRDKIDMESCLIDANTILSYPNNDSQEIVQTEMKPEHYSTTPVIPRLNNTKPKVDYVEDNDINVMVTVYQDIDRDEAKQEDGCLSESAHEDANESSLSKKSNVKSKPKYQCPRCKEKPCRWRKFTQHMAGSHNECVTIDNKLKYLTGDDNTGKKSKPKPKYQCPTCQQMPFKWKALKNHIGKVHNQVWREIDQESCLIDFFPSDSSNVSEEIL